MQLSNITIVYLIWGSFFAMIIGFLFLARWYIRKINHKRNAEIHMENLTQNFDESGIGKHRFEGWAVAAGKLPGMQSGHFSGKNPQPKSLPKNLFNLPDLNLNNQQKQELLERLEMQILDLNIGLQQLGIGPNHAIMGKIDDLYRIFQMLRRVARTENYNPDYMVDLIYYQMLYNLTHDLKPFNSKQFYPEMHDMLVHATFQPIKHGTLTEILQYRYNEIITKVDREEKYDRSTIQGIHPEFTQDIKNALKNSGMDKPNMTEQEAE